MKSDEARIEQEAFAAGLRVIGPGLAQRSKGSRLYEFIKCGHHQEIRLSDVRKLNFRCQQCFDDELNLDAAKVGLRILAAVKDANYRLCQFVECSHQQEIQVVRIRHGGFKCQQCFDEKLRQEASSVGLQYIGKGTSNASGLYRLGCGHQQEFRFQHVRTNVFKCQECLEGKVRREAADAGVQLIGPGATSDYRLYRLSCGHSKEMQLVHVRARQTRCPQCLNDKHEQEAAKVGLRPVGEGKSAQYRLYEFVVCGHLQELLIRNVAAQSVLCQQCVINRFDQEAERAGLRIVGSGKNKAYRLYEFAECKHLQELRIAHVRDRNFACRECDPDAGGYNKDKPGAFYVYSLESRALRTTGFGITGNESARRKAHTQNLNQRCITIMDARVWSHDDGMAALKLEGAVRRKFPRDKDMGTVPGFKRESTKVAFSEVCAFVDRWLEKHAAKLGRGSGTRKPSPDQIFA